MRIFHRYRLFPFRRLTIGDLGHLEKEVMKELESFGGGIYDKTELILKKKVFEKYNHIHFNYSILALEGNVEALKRGLFIQCYPYIEPWFLTGIPDGISYDRKDLSILNYDAMRNIFERASEYFLSPECDDEFRWIILDIFEPDDKWIFDQFLLRDDFINTLSKLWNETRPTNTWMKFAPPKESLIGRGQMGEHFLSIYDNYAKEYVVDS